jgi:hypothetical protein
MSPSARCPKGIRSSERLAPPVHDGPEPCGCRKDEYIAWPRAASVRTGSRRLDTALSSAPARVTTRDPDRLRCQRIDAVEIDPSSRASAGRATCSSRTRIRECTAHQRRAGVPAHDEPEA